MWSVQFLPVHSNLFSGKNEENKEHWFAIHPFLKALTYRGRGRETVVGGERHPSAAPECHDADVFQSQQKTKSKYRK